MDTFFDERKPKAHVGYNLRRIREIIGMKQDVLGMMMKNQIKQQTVSRGNYLGETDRCRTYRR